MTINNNAPHLKSPKNQNRRAALGRPAIKITGGLELVCGRPTLALSSAMVLQVKHLQTTKTKHKRRLFPSENAIKKNMFNMHKVSSMPGSKNYSPTYIKEARKG